MNENNHDRPTQLAMFGLEDERPYEPQFQNVGKGNRPPSAKLKAFVRHYIETRKLRESAIKAGYSKKNSHVIASRLLKKEYVQNMIRAEEEASLKRLGVTVDRFFKELTRLAYFDIRKLYREDGSLKHPSEWDDETASAVVSLEVFEEFENKGKNKNLIGFVKKIKASDKKGALELLAKSMGLLRENIVFPDKDGNPQDVSEKRLVVEFVGVNFNQQIETEKKG